MLTSPQRIIAPTISGPSVRPHSQAMLSPVAWEAAVTVRILSPALAYTLLLVTLVVRLSVMTPLLVVASVWATTHSKLSKTTPALRTPSQTRERASMRPWTEDLACSWRWELTYPGCFLFHFISDFSTGDVLLERVMARSSAMHGPYLAPKLLIAWTSHLCPKYFGVTIPSIFAMLICPIGAEVIFVEPYSDISTS